MNILIFILSILAGIYILLFIASLFIEKPNNTFDMYFGVPGSGKTTFAAYLAKKAQKKKKPVYSNVDIKECFKLERNDIGIYQIENGLILLDEAGVEFNSRNYQKNFSNSQVDFFRRHRHYNVDIACFSQYWNDCDIILRKLSTRLYLLKKSFIPFFIVRKTISKRIGIDDLSKQIIDEYYYRPFSTKRIFTPSVWKMFNTHEKLELPTKEWEIY